MTYNKIVSCVETLEKRWYDGLSVFNPDPRFANGEVQFFAVEKKANVKPDEDLPVVLAIGINYTQNKDCHVWPKPCLGTNGVPAVTGEPSRMFNVLNDTFLEYSRRPSGWVERCLASDTNISVPEKDRYILIAANFSPLITFESWQDNPSQFTTNLLSLFSWGFKHLDDLMTTLAKNSVKLEVVVGHGLGSEVPTLFRKWHNQRNDLPWLLTSNLARPLPKGPNAFYNKEVPPIQERKIADSLYGHTEVPPDMEVE